jgi:predicted transcriptional regulator
MNLVLRPDLEQFVEEQISAGHYPTPQALIEQAITEFRDGGLVPLDDDAVAAINEGLEQADRGEGVDLDTFRFRFFSRRSRS